jgi:DNA-binding NarL/FixJ family response regulator
MLADAPGLEVIGEAADGLEALDLCRRVRPDLILMDLRMPRMDGLQATRLIKEEHPKTSVLVLTMHENTDYLLEALRVGAAGYILKDADYDDVVGAIQKVLIGESPLAPQLAARLLRRLALDVQRPGLAPLDPQGAKLPQPLTPREIEVLEQLAQGKTNPEIAEEFVITIGTVKNHVEHLIAKLGVSDRTQAVVRALELGIISFPER